MALRGSLRALGLTSVLLLRLVHKGAGDGIAMKRKDDLCRFAEATKSELIHCGVIDGDPQDNILRLARRSCLAS